MMMVMVTVMVMVMVMVMVVVMVMVMVKRMGPLRIEREIYQTCKNTDQYHMGIWLRLDIW